MGRPKGSKNKIKKAGGIKTAPATNFTASSDVNIINNNTDVEQIIAALESLFKAPGIDAALLNNFDVFSRASALSQSTPDADLSLGGLNMHDVAVYPACRERFIESINDIFVPDVIAGKNNKVHIARWTNRVAIWRFFERFYRPIVLRYLEELLPYITYQIDKVFPENHPARTGSHETKVKWALNPFHSYGAAFPHVLKAWTPKIRDVVKMFVQKTRDGSSYAEDFKSLGDIAFIFALEKHAMGMLSSNRISQGIPFPNRLVFAIKKEIYAAIPNITGPFKIPIESAFRNTLPYEIGLDDWLKFESDEY